MRRLKGSLATRQPHRCFKGGGFQPRFPGDTDRPVAERRAINSRRAAQERGVAAQNDINRAQAAAGAAASAARLQQAAAGLNDRQVQRLVRARDTGNYGGVSAMVKQTTGRRGRVSSIQMGMDIQDILRVRGVR